VAATSNRRSAAVRVCALAVLVSAAGRHADGSANDYLNVVREYSTGDVNAAAARMLRLPLKDIEAGLDALGDGAEPGLVEPAVALHTEIALRSVGISLPARLEHLSRARRLVAFDVVHAPFKRLWCVSAGVYLASQGLLAELEAHVKRTREWLPEDPEIILLSAIANEMQASPPIRPATSEGDRRRHLANAERDLRAVLAQVPDRQEARLRLGKVLETRGDHREARQYLEPLVDVPDPRLAYLASLFLAAAADAENDVAAAARWYERATRTLPLAQSARVGSSELHARAGRRDEAARALRVTTTTPSVMDPWWAYPFGEFWRVGTLADALRVQARQ
jgi:tetratricopeptide (TPR) repeat protein